MTSNNGLIDQNEILWSRLSDLVRDTIGLYYPMERRSDLKRGIAAASSAFGKSSPESCADWLLSTSLTRKQIGILASHLTIGETYFFRDRGSFEIIERHILPILLRDRISTKQLRIWSAGCCTGEEAYSIAISLAQLIPNRCDWNIHILATDIDPNYLHKASLGIYSDWSFRDTPPDIKKKFFNKTTKGHFEIAHHIKSMVSFSYHNLVQDTFPSIENGIYAMDIIFCRNVLMYFEKSHSLLVLQKLSNTLMESGWLFLSTCESPIIGIPELVSMNIFNAIVHRKDICPSQDKLSTLLLGTIDLSNRVEPAVSRPFVPNELIVKSMQSVEASSETMTEAEIMLLYEEGYYEQVIRTTLKTLSQNPGDVWAMTLLVRSYANLGHLRDALTWCKKALAADKLNTGLYYLYAILLQEQGLDDEAAKALKRSLYLDQNNALAHYSLGNLFRRQKRHQQASRHFLNALTILDGYPQDNIFSGSEGITAGGLANLIKSTIAMEEPE